MGMAMTGWEAVEKLRATKEGHIICSMHLSFTYFFDGGCLMQKNIRTNEVEPSKLTVYELGKTAFKISVEKTDSEKIESLDSRLTHLEIKEVGLTSDLFETKVAINEIIKVINGKSVTKPMKLMDVSDY